MTHRNHTPIDLHLVASKKTTKVVNVTFDGSPRQRTLTEHHPARETGSYDRLDPPRGKVFNGGDGRCSHEHMA
jgi:hypothetical protein